MAKKQLPPSNSQPLVVSAFYILIVVAFAAGLFAGFLVWGTGHTNPPQQAAAQTQNQAPQAAAQATQGEPKRYDVSTDDDPALGPATAPVTIIEFSDYQCPYCRQWAEQVEGELIKTYGDKIRIVYRDFPLTQIHPEALPAAEAADCAGEQGKYWEYHDALFKQSKGLGQEAYLAYAKELGLNIDQFQQCIQEHRYRDEVQADAQYAAQLGVRSTPTFFINGIPVVGAQPFSVFKQIIDQELAAQQ